MSMGAAASVLHALLIESFQDPYALSAQKVTRQYLSRSSDSGSGVPMIDVEDVDEETWGTSPEAVAALDAAKRSFGG